MRDEKNRDVVRKKEWGKGNREVHRKEREKKKRVITKERGGKGLSSAYERIWNSVQSKFGSRNRFMVHRISRGLRVCLVW